jgi:cytosine/adenosine deaminase-related metal-dependent hydrolase
MLSNGPLRSIRFLEVMGMPGGGSGVGHWIDEQLSAMNSSKLFQPGLQPHAPYSTGQEAYRSCLDRARRHGYRLTTHLSETREESQFLATGHGPFRELLERRGLWDGSFHPPRCTPIEYARRMELLDHPTLLAHVNYLDDEGLRLLAESDCSVAFCPRTHHFFSHAQHPFRRMLEADVNVCLGTDGLGSHAGGARLSILDEIRFLKRVHPDMSASTLLEMATINGARALGLDRLIGSIEQGKSADLTIIPMEPGLSESPVENIVESKTQPVATFVMGRRVFDP